jgi:hypothetical protein
MRFLSGMVALVVVGTAHAQTPLVPPTSPSPYGAMPAPVTTLPLAAQNTPPTAPPPLLNSPSSALVPGTTLSSPSAGNWQNSSGCYCCSPVGGNGPIGAELYLYTGPTLPAGGGAENHLLDPGWMVEWGGHSLFFNTAGTAAWVATLGISYQYNIGDLKASPVPIFNIPVFARNMSRWAFVFGGGRDWFLFNSGADGGPGKNLRFGFDLGGRWGTSHISLQEENNPNHANNYIRRQDVFRSFYMGAHLDAEVPMGGWVWFGGFRTEYCFNWWTDLMPGSDNRLNDLNLLISTGIRY